MLGLQGEEEGGCNGLAGCPGFMGHEAGGRGGAVKDCGEAEASPEEHRGNWEVSRIVAQKDRSNRIDSASRCTFQSGFKVSTKM